MPGPGDERSPAELEARREAEQRGDPFLVYHDGTDSQRILSLSDGWERATIGRSSYADLCLSWDSEVSRMHAQLERMGDDWTLIDDGLSRNGSFVNGEPVHGRRRLADSDELRFGDTTVTFHTPFRGGQETRLPRP
ncbi:MAG TPA: FHA domain-containing protein [Thermoleophilaceae bacterium]|nr:FHA domain-containing protein [Thermoleophilaceae bacterium]